MHLNNLLVSIVSLACLLGCTGPEQPAAVRTGLDRVAEHQGLFAGKRIGIIANHTAVARDGRFITEVFEQLPDVEIKALFGPEHGFDGTAAAGDPVTGSANGRLGVPIHSLYGETRKPTPEMLAGIDLLVFDIQDIGARFYTYVYTMSLAMEAAAENGIGFVVLDRPNPINGVQVEGNLLEPDFATFVGLYPIPVRHGLTAGELARMIDGEGWLSNGVRADPQVVEMTGWKRELWYDETGLTWRAPSPNMPTLAVAIAYPGMCLFEGTGISEGRGTYSPFLRIGAPWFSPESFGQINQVLDVSGVHFGPIRFTPKPLPGMAPAPKHMDRECIGVSVNVSDRENYHSYLAGITLVKYMYEANRAQFEWRVGHFDRLCGTDAIRRFIMDGLPVAEIAAWMAGHEEIFRRMRRPYLLYE